jgi:osmotically-inducible protein OsmY
VGGFAEKLAAEIATRRIGGVTAIVNDLEVQLLPERIHEDGAIAEAAINALRWNVNIPINSVSVTVEHGWIKLEGLVPWFYQRRAAENALRYVKGVKGVTNLITVHQKVSPVDVKPKIEAAFRRSAAVDAAHVGQGWQGHIAGQGNLLCGAGQCGRCRLVCTWCNERKE